MDKFSKYFKGILRYLEVQINRIKDILRMLKLLNLFFSVRSCASLLHNNSKETKKARKRKNKCNLLDNLSSILLLILYHYNSINTQLMNGQHFYIHIAKNYGLS